MLNFTIDKPSGAPELIPLFVGYEKCAPSHRFGPYVRDSYLIHYCLSGCGKLTDKYGTHKISEGELFIIRPGEVTVYEADGADPWKYVWIGFAGERASALDSLPSVLSAPVDAFLRIRARLEEGISAPDIYISALYEIFYSILTVREEDICSSVKRYISYNYMNDISVSHISRRFGFERSYLYRIFKERFGMGIKEYMTDVRMKHAREFLTLGYSVAKTAAMTGYADAQTFSRAYKNHLGKSPSEALGKAEI